MRLLTLEETKMVGGGADAVFNFTGAPVSVPNVKAIQEAFVNAVASGAVGGAYTGAIMTSTSGPGAAVGAVGGALMGGLGGGMTWMVTVAMNTPTVTYTPVITIEECGATDCGGP